MQKISKTVLQSLLCGIEKPGRYTGGEFGSLPDNCSGTLYAAVSYPDLYEIGMSNNAVRILYGMLNEINGVVCERVFAPAPDLEKALIAEGIPLFTLESRYVLSDLDILAFSIGYELTFTNIFTILERGGIPLHNSERGEEHPLVIAGGPAVINPEPYGNFVDGLWVGESEQVLPQVFSTLAESRASGASRKDLLDILASCPHFWMKGVKERAERGVWSGFGCSGSTGEKFMPVPTIRTVQAQGVVEIMRGCPNGCRFCNAGSMYKPVREKDIDHICREIDTLVVAKGLREITLSSLSSGDYSQIYHLMRTVNNRYQGMHVSFSLPSLKVDSFTFGLLKELSRVRKSGLTFAVETPEDQWQSGINKRASRDKIIEILKEAKSSGWKLAKFYFMIGLPAADEETEAAKIIAFINSVRAEVSMSLNVNIGTFVPKPHTPFQWAKQLSDSEAMPKMIDIKNAFRNRPVKINYHSPFLSMLEGIITRGDERGGDLFLSAYKKGARLDAWEDYLDRDLWIDVIKTASWDVEGETCRARGLDEELPWDSLDMGISKGFLRKEYDKALTGKETGVCNEECRQHSGVCREELGTRRVGVVADDPGTPLPAVVSEAGYTTCIFGFRKIEEAVYVSHLDVIRMFEHTFQRAGAAVRFTQGFNPKPKLEFAHPLSLGIASLEEIGMIEFGGVWEEDELINKLNGALPAGFSVTRLKKVIRKKGEKKRSLMSLFWGAEYDIVFNQESGQEQKERIIGKIADYIESGASYSECYEYCSKENGFSLRIKNMNKKEASLKYLMREIVGIQEYCRQFSIIRTRLYGENKGEPVDYFSLF